MNLSLGKKLFAGFGGVVLLMLVLGLLSLSRMGSMNSATGLVGDKALGRVAAIGDARSAVETFRRAQLQHDAKGMDSAKADFAASANSFKAHVSDSADVKTMDQLQAEWTKFLDAPNEANFEAVDKAATWSVVKEATWAPESAAISSVASAPICAPVRAAMSSVGSAATWLLDSATIWSVLNAATCSVVSAASVSVANAATCAVVSAAI